MEACRDVEVVCGHGCDGEDVVEDGVLNGEVRGWWWSQAYIVSGVSFDARCGPDAERGLPLGLIGAGTSSCRSCCF